MRIAVHELAVLLGIGRAIRVSDAGIMVPCRGFRLQRNRDRLVGGDRPGMKQIEVRWIDRHALVIRKAGVLVVSRVASDSTSGFHGLLHRRGAEVRAARRTLAVLEVHDHAEAVVPRMLDGLDLAHPDVDVDAGGSTEHRLRRTGALAPGCLDRQGHDLAQRVDLRHPGRLGAAICVVHASPNARRWERAMRILPGFPPTHGSLRETADIVGAGVISHCVPLWRTSGIAEPRVAFVRFRLAQGQKIRSHASFLAVRRPDIGARRVG